MGWSGLCSITENIQPRHWQWRLASVTLLFVRVLFVFRSIRYIHHTKDFDVCQGGSDLVAIFSFSGEMAFFD